MKNAYVAWRAGLYLSGSYPYLVADDVALQSYSHNFTYKLGGELDYIFLGEKIRDDL